MRIHYYNDLREYKTCVRPRRKVKSNLCTMYYTDKKRFCGNYCSRKSNKYNKRCWRHRNYSVGPKLVLLMISSSGRVYNRELWLNFLTESEKNNVPIELVIYHEDMLNCTVRNPHNLISRYRPFPDLFGGRVIPLGGKHGTLDFAQVHLQMLEYGANIQDAVKCIVITERTIPIRSPIDIYKQVVASSSSKCHFDVSYNVKFGHTPDGLPKSVRGRPFAAANNMAQGTFSVDFLKLALPTVPRHCKYFGLHLTGREYKIVNDTLYNQWCRFTGANPCEFWLVNSFLIEEHLKGGVPMRALGQLMEKSNSKERYSVAEIPEWRDGVKRTFVFRQSMSAKQRVPPFNSRVAAYYRGLNFNRLTLRDTINFLQKNKRKALFFRQVELP